MDLLKDWLYIIISKIAYIHDSIERFARTLPVRFTDKDLHFIVIGLFGLVLLLVALPLFRALTRRGSFGLMAWLFTLSTVVMISFAIEIGQVTTGTGRMEMEDIVYGLLGFLAVSAVVGLVRLMLCLLRRILKRDK